jgi:SHS2 domain-containing protein
MADHGHRLEPHTADLVVTAWSSTEAGCLAEAVRGLTESFAEITRAAPTATREWTVCADSPAERLVAVLEEVVYLLDTRGEVAVDTEIQPVAGGRVRGEFIIVPLSATTPTGPAPKGIARHGLHHTERDDHWQCRVVIDV